MNYSKCVQAGITLLKHLPNFYGSSYISA